MKKFEEQKIQNRRIYWSVISLVALSCGGTALGQSYIGTGVNGAAVNTSTNGVSSGSSTNVTNLGNVTVIGNLDKARSNILPDLGATAYTHTAAQIETQSQGADAPFNEVHLALSRRGAGFRGKRRFARPRRAREFAISH